MWPIVAVFMAPIVEKKLSSKFGQKYPTIERIGVVTITFLIVGALFLILGVISLCMFAPIIKGFGWQESAMQTVKLLFS